jgi:hypothetical protein
MAGNYMDAPSYRLAYDRDGSVAVKLTSAGSMQVLSATDLQLLNDEGETGLAMSTQRRLAIVFPVPVDLNSVFIALNSNNATLQVETSKDSTTGADGTWDSNIIADVYLRDVRPHYRLAANLKSFLPSAVSQEVRAVRFSFSDNVSLTFKGIHLYGAISSSATADRLAFWQPATDAEVGPAHFDWGNVPRGTSADKSFRLKNLSSTLTATDIDVFAEALTPGTPSVAGMRLFSLNGTTWTSTVNIASLAPGAISPVIYVRRVVPTNAQVSVWTARIIADVGSWA